MKKSKQSAKRNPLFYCRYWIVVIVVIVLDILVDVLFHDILNEMFPTLSDSLVSSMTGWPAVLVGIVLWYWLFFRDRGEKA